MWVVAAGSAWRARRKASNLPFRGGFVAKGCQVLQMVAFVTEWPAGVLACTLRNRDRWKAARCGAWRRCSRGRHEQGWFLSRSGRVQPPSTPRPTRWHDSSGFPCPGLGAATHYGMLQWLLARFRLANRHCDIAYAVAGHQTNSRRQPMGWTAPHPCSHGFPFLQSPLDRGVIGIDQGLAHGGPNRCIFR